MRRKLRTYLTTLGVAVTTFFSGISLAGQGISPSAIYHTVTKAGKKPNISVITDTGSAISYSTEMAAVYFTENAITKKSKLTTTFSPPDLSSKTFVFEARQEEGELSDIVDRYHDGISNTWHNRSDYEDTKERRKGLKQESYQELSALLRDKLGNTQWIATHDIIKERLKNIAGALTKKLGGIPFSYTGPNGLENSIVYELKARDLFDIRWNRETDTYVVKITIFPRGEDVKTLGKHSEHLELIDHKYRGDWHSPSNYTLSFWQDESVQSTLKKHEDKEAWTQDLLAELLSYPRHIPPLD